MTREHENSATCWCKPRNFQACPECEPFDLKNEHVQLFVAEAICVHQPIAGVTARRPRKAKGCWKCGGDGLVETDKPEGTVFTAHRGTTDGDDADDTPA